MPASRSKFSDLLQRARRSFVYFATGGDWAIALPDKIHRNLVWFWFDGFFAAACDNIALTYLAVYLLALGATQTQIGVLSSLSSLVAALMLFPGAMLVERIGRRKHLAVTGGVGARLVLGILAALPLFLSGPTLVTVAIGVSLLRDGFANLGFPAWMAITADIVPLAGRGRYFASRNFVMGVAGMVTTLGIGFFIARTASPGGYQIALVIALILGSGSTFCFAHLKDSNPKASGGAISSFKFHDLYSELVSNRAFLILIGTTALWNLALNVAGPFFTVYLVKNLHADAAMVGMTSIATSLGTLLSQRKLGELADRWGARKLQVVCELVIPVLPILWALVNASWQIIPINVLSGVLWAGYNLSSFNYLLELAPPEKRARYSALFQFTVTISLALGAALGSVIVTFWGFIAVFLGSAIGRIIAAGLFARLSSQVRQELRPAAAQNQTGVKRLP
ncbi:MAG TPA: MFS transporter [Anaerolineaceae bacterium]|nr:MFS transporter [Anaerolineaceae bacterium]